ncbi:MAG TPA: hypothetical protein VFT45_14330 [Longimicrobium sp.]|nr:hypothetical protein [Longimicrobium sp.]
MAVLLSAGAAVHLARDARVVRHNGEPVASTLARYSADGPGVVIIFQPEDCLGDGNMVRRWNTLASAPGLNVRGLVTGGDLSSTQKTIFAQTGARMALGNISSADASLVGGKLGYTRTPFALVLDGRGRVAGSFPANQNIPPEVVTTLVSGS